MEPLDFRKGLNGTAGACRKLCEGSHLTGALCLFVNRNKTMMRCYSFGGHGDILVIKQIAKGKFNEDLSQTISISPAT